MKKKLNTLLIYDEGDAIFSRHAEQSMLGYPTASILLTTSRASGIGVVVITHQPHLVLTSLRSEAYTRVVFNLSDAQDARYMAQACSLNREEEAFISKLPNYHAIVRTRRCERPFVIRIPNYADLIRSKPAVNSEHAQAKIKEISKHIIPRRQDAQLTSIEKPEYKEDIAFNEDAVRLLNHIYRHPFKTVVERYSELSFSASAGSKATNELIRKNLITKIPIKTSKGRGNRSVFFEITKEGLKKISKTRQPFIGKGGLRHSYYIHRAEQYYLKQHDTEETMIEYKDCDLVVETPEGLIAVEVCIHIENIETNLRRNEENGFTTTLIFESKAQLNKAQSKFNLSGRAELKLIDEYL